MTATGCFVLGCFVGGFICSALVLILAASGFKACEETERQLSLDLSKVANSLFLAERAAKACGTVADCMSTHSKLQGERAIRIEAIQALHDVHEELDQLGVSLREKPDPDIRLSGGAQSYWHREGGAA